MHDVPRTARADDRMLGLRTIAIAAVVVVVVVDVTWDGTSLHILVGWAVRRPIASFAFPSTGRLPTVVRASRSPPDGESA